MNELLRHAARDAARVGAALQAGSRMAEQSESDLPRMPAVTAALESIEKRVHALNDAVSALSLRLEPVLRPDEPRKGEAQLHAIGDCQLSAAINQQGERVTDAEHLLRNLLDRLEI